MRKLKKAAQSILGKNKFKPTNYEKYYEPGIVRALEKADKARKAGNKKAIIGTAAALATGIYAGKKAKNNTTPSKPVKKKTAKTATKKYKF